MRENYGESDGNSKEGLLPSYGDLKFVVLREMRKEDTGEKAKKMSTELFADLFGQLHDREYSRKP